MSNQSRIVLTSKNKAMVSKKQKHKQNHSKRRKVNKQNRFILKPCFSKWQKEKYKLQMVIQYLGYKESISKPIARHSKPRKYLIRASKNPKKKIHTISDHRIMSQKQKKMFKGGIQGVKP